MNRLRAHKTVQLKVVEPTSAVQGQALAALKLHSQAVATMMATEGDTFKEQPDLMYVEAVLVTEGLNDNDDGFLHEELVSAQGSPLLKPINMGHNDKSIVGVMYGVTARRLDGTLVTEDDGSEFELVMHGVVWHYLPHLRGVADRIAENFANGNCFVSMECWFQGYDYGLYNSEGILEDVIKRDNSTAHLEKHLRVRGGSGSHNGKRIGRALRDITFGGVAFVDIPANRRSDVLNVFVFDPDGLEQDETRSGVDSTSTPHRNDTVVLFEEGSMNDTTNKAVAHADGNDLRKMVDEGVSGALSNERARVQAEGKAQELTSANAKIADLESKLEVAQTALARAHDAVEDGYQSVKATAGATGDTPEEIARIDRAKDGNDAFTAKIAFIAQTSGRAQANASEELQTLRDENAKLKAEVREHTRAGEIAETFAGVLSDDEIEGLVKSGLAKSDEDYATWLDEHKAVIAAKPDFLKKGDEKNGKKDEKKAKSRILTPAQEQEKLQDNGVALNPRHGKVPSAVPGKQSLAAGDVDLSDHFDEVKDDVNLEGADASADDENDNANPFADMIGEIYTKPRQAKSARFSRAVGDLRDGEGS